MYRTAAWSGRCLWLMVRFLLPAGSSSRLDCLLELWDSLALRHRGCRSGELRTGAAMGSDVEAADGTSRGAELCDGVEPTEPAGVQTLDPLSDRPKGSQRAAPSGRRVHPCQRGGSDTLSVSGRPVDPEVAAAQRSARLEHKGLCGSQGELRDSGAAQPPGPHLVMVAGDASDPSRDCELSSGDDPRPDLSPLSRPSYSPCSESLCSPAAELASSPLSKPPASLLSDVSTPTTDSGLSELTADEPCSSLELSTAGDSTGDEAARTLLELPRPAAARDRRAARWRTAELRPRPLSAISTASSSCSSGGGSLPRALGRRRPARGAAADVTGETSGHTCERAVTGEMRGVRGLSQVR